MYCDINPLNAELNPICHLLALLGAHNILHISRMRVNGKVSSCLNNGLQESLGLEFVIILITLFCSLKTWTLCVELPQKIIP